jgi:hypothetical protein
MPPEPRRLREEAKAVSERLLSLITRTSPLEVRVQNVLLLQCVGLIDGSAVRRRYVTKHVVRETEVESLCGLLGEGPPVGPDPTRKNDPKRKLEASAYRHPQMSARGGVDIQKEASARLPVPTVKALQVWVKAGGGGPAWLFRRNDQRSCETRPVPRGIRLFSTRRRKSSIAEALQAPDYRSWPR